MRPLPRRTSRGWPEQYLHPDQLILVAAGDRAKIETPLKEAGVGPVEVRDITGNLATDTAK